MSTFENKKRHQPHLKIPEDASESQVLIFLGEEALERAHRVGHGIEECVRKLLDSSPSSSESKSPTPRDQFLSNRRAGDSQDEAEDKGAVDNPKRRW